MPLLSLFQTLTNLTKSWNIIINFKHFKASSKARTMVVVYHEFQFKVLIDKFNELFKQKNYNICFTSRCLHEYVKHSYSTKWYYIKLGEAHIVKQNIL